MTAAEIETEASPVTQLDAWRLAVLAGDGVGQEVTREALQVLRALEQRLEGLRFDLQEISAGAREYANSGDPLPEAALETCRRADAILLGAMGLPSVRWPDGRELTPQLDLREQLDLYCGIRPVHLYHANDTPLKRFGAGEIDFVIVRENTEGLFSARQSKGNGSAAEACDTLRITRRGAERLFRSAFQIARQRRRKVTLVDKANVLPSMVFFRAVFDEVAREFPEVKTERVYVDAAALYLLRCPDRFDVLVTENMFGDILSDLGASLVGGMGMAPAADIGDRHAVFQPAHGSAPDIAGQGIANPIAAILTVALMLDWLDEPETRRGAAMIRAAVETVLADPENRTPDCGGRLSTSEMGELLLANL
jgi:3-isopropylmalate dehydrogenase